MQIFSKHYYSGPLVIIPKILAKVFLKKHPENNYIFFMTNSTPHLPDRVIFLADVHLGLPGDTSARMDRFAAFLRWIHGKAAHLYIVGDLFDFWFEYRRVVPNTAPQVLCELYHLIRSGMKITLLAGNHDYWFGPYLRESIGLETFPDEVGITCQGRHVLIHHGDGLYPRDYGYRLLKKILRHPVSIGLFGLIHPDLAHRIASFTSKTSRQYLAPPPGRDEHYAELFRRIADEKLKQGYDAVIYGHSHVRLLEKRERGTLILLGDWINYSTYAVLENGQFSLQEWNPETEKMYD
jgi:UDP-2,3-diacylglucosamine hydrolase